MTQVISLKIERDKRIIRKALTIRRVKRVVGHWSGPEAEAYLKHFSLHEEAQTHD